MRPSARAAPARSASTFCSSGWTTSASAMKSRRHRPAQFDFEHGVGTVRAGLHHVVRDRQLDERIVPVKQDQRHRGQPGRLQHHVVMRRCLQRGQAVRFPGPLPQGLLAGAQGNPVQVQEARTVGGVQAQPFQRADRARETARRWRSSADDAVSRRSSGLRRSPLSSSTYSWAEKRASAGSGATGAGCSGLPAVDAAALQRAAPRPPTGKWPRPARPAGSAPRTAATGRTKP